MYLFPVNTANLFSLLSFPVKLAIWEVALDNFVESIQSIPEVQWTINSKNE